MPDATGSVTDYTARCWNHPNLSLFLSFENIPEQLNIKAVTGACKLIDGCSLNSIQLHDSIVKGHPIK